MNIIITDFGSNLKIESSDSINEKPNQVTEAASSVLRSAFSPVPKSHSEHVASLRSKQAPANQVRLIENPRNVIFRPIYSQVLKPQPVALPLPVKQSPVFNQAGFVQVLRSKNWNILKEILEDRNWDLEAFKKKRGNVPIIKGLIERAVIENDIMVLWALGNYTKNYAEVFQAVLLSEDLEFVRNFLTAAPERIAKKEDLPSFYYSILNHLVDLDDLETFSVCIKCIFPQAEKEQKGGAKEIAKCIILKIADEITARIVEKYDYQKVSSMFYSKELEELQPELHEMKKNSIISLMKKPSSRQGTLGAENSGSSESST